MRGGIIALLIFLWLLSGDEGPRLDHLQKALNELQDEANVSGNRTFGVNPIPQSVSAELTKLFQPEGRDPRAHYYHNVTGSFKGDWSFDEGIAANVDQEFPLPPAPPKDETKNGTAIQDGGESIKEITASEGEGTKQGGGATTALAQEAGETNNTITGDEATETPVDTIEDKRAHFLEDVEKFRGPFQFNESGSFTFNIKETKATEYVNWVKGSWTFRHDDNEDYGIALSVQGVHFVNNGTFYMWGIPEQEWMPSWRILDLMPNNASFALAFAALQEHYQKRIKVIEDIMEGHDSLEYPEASLSEPSSCHYQMYMQLGAINPSVRSTAIKDLEREWAAPQGISTIKPPHLNSTLFIYSPNCRLTIGVKKAEGMKREKFYAKAVNYAGMAGTVAFIQVFLLVRQMEYTPTPSGVSKVSYWTIALQVFIDSYLCMLHLTTGVLI
ncbi:hypothetical protein BGZ54_008222, partial [Gamsiella multidivaricata]